MIADFFLYLDKIPHEISINIFLNTNESEKIVYLWPTNFYDLSKIHVTY